MMRGVGHFGNLLQRRLLAAQDRNLRQDVHALDFCGDAEVFARTFFHPQHAGMAANPAFLSRGEFRRKDEDQFHVRALHHAGCGIEENAVGADVASLAPPVPRSLLHF